MLVKVVMSFEEVDTFTVNADSIKAILNYIKMIKGEEYSKNLINNHFKYVLVDSTETLKPVGLVPEVIFGEFTGYDTLIILRGVCGEVTAAVVGGVILAATGTFVSFAVAAIIAFVVNIVISIVISFIISLLSPTPEFSSDPSQSVNRKQSSLFNGAPLIREQGGIVPIVLGNPFAGGVLISSGVSTEDTI